MLREPQGGSKPVWFHTFNYKSLQITPGLGRNRQVSPSPYCTATAIYGSHELCSFKKCPWKHFSWKVFPAYFNGEGVSVFI